MIPYIVRSIQELAEQNTIQSTQIAPLESQVALQQIQIAKLMSQIQTLTDRLATAGIA
jgi:uncharacterized coiled-coil protein SlyX